MRLRSEVCVRIAERKLGERWSKAILRIQLLDEAIERRAHWDDRIMVLLLIHEGQRVSVGDETAPVAPGHSHGTQPVWSLDGRGDTRLLRNFASFEQGRIDFAGRLKAEASGGREFGGHLPKNLVGVGCRLRGRDRPGEKRESKE